MQPHRELLKAEKHEKEALFKLKLHILHAARKTGQAYYVSLHPALNTILQIIQSNPPGMGKQRD